MGEVLVDGYRFRMHHFYKTVKSVQNDAADQLAVEHFKRAPDIYEGEWLCTYFNYQVQFTRTVCKNLHKNGVWIFPSIPPLGLALLIFQLLYHVNFDGKFYVGMSQKSKKQAEMSAAHVALRWA
ncbi:hypothetical protein ACFE04_022912 [Oxalis oulophora]